MINNKQWKHARDLCEIREIGVIDGSKSYTLKVPIAGITTHRTIEEAIETRDKTIAKLLWVPPYE